MEHILISGASSGIGAALAKSYAGPGVSLSLWGRNETRLAAVADDCRRRGAQVVTRCFDLTDIAVLKAELAAADDTAPVDVAIFNAGLGGSLPHDAIAQDAERTEMMAMVNFTAPAVGANVIAEKMGARRSGRIVLIGSVAGLFPLPMAPTYSGSKAGLMMFAEALRNRLKRFGVAVTLVSPGFVDTPMSQGLKEPRPFLIPADKAASVIKRKVSCGARHVVVPWQFAVIAAMAGFIPKVLVRSVLSAF